MVQRARGSESFIAQGREVLTGADREQFREALAQFDLRQDPEGSKPVRRAA